MKKLTNAQLFAAPKITRKAKERLERAKLAMVAARSRAVNMAQRYPAKPLMMRLSVLQTRRLAERLSAVRR